MPSKKVSNGYTAGQASLWVQPDGPATTLNYLGCHNVGDIDVPAGDITLRYCPDPEAVDQWVRTGVYQGEPGPVTTTIETIISKGRDWLERNLCAGPIYLLKFTCGKRNVFENWERAFILDWPYRTGRTLSALMSRNPGDNNESMQSFALSALDLIEALEPTVVRQATSEPGALNDIAFCNVQKCADACGPAEDLCESGLAGGDFRATSIDDKAANVYTEDSGSTWTEWGADPFLNNEIISSVACFQIDKDTTRWIVARGDTDAGNPAEIAYSDDSGDTWTLVDVGAVDGQYFPDAGSLHVLDNYHIWAGTDDGYIYFSADGGLTWTAQEEGDIAAVPVNGIFALDENTIMAVGGTDQVWVTVDGGANWAAGGITGDAGNLTCVYHNSDQLWFVGSSTGHLYYSDDDGLTWTEQTFPSSGTGNVADIGWANRLCGWMVWNSATPVGKVLHTINGGTSWKVLSTPDNSGLNAVWVCDCNTAYAVGETYSGTAAILKAAPSEA